MKSSLRAVAAAALLSGACREKPVSAKSDAPPASREACVDRWLRSRGLNPYGDPPGTAYLGGTPLFDERTGESVDRLEYVFRKHPEAARDCGQARGGDG